MQWGLMHQCREWGPKSLFLLSGNHTMAEAEKLAAPWELSEAEHRDFPGDYEAQVSQGAITAHSAEHLRTSDRGVALLRRFLREQLAAVAHGDDPSGVARGPDADAMQRFANCGNFLAG